MKKTVSKWLLILIPLVIGVGLIYYQFTTLSSEQINTIKVSFQKANYNYIYLSLVIAILGHWFRAYRWEFSLNHLGYKSQFKNNFLIVCVSYLVNLTIPRSGEVSRAALLKKYEEIPFDKAFGTIVAERIVDLLLFFIFVIIGFILQFDTLYKFLLSKNITLQSLIYFGVLLLILAIVFICIWIYAEWKIIKKLKKKLSGLTEGIMSVYRMEKKWWYVFHSLMIWLCYLAMFYVAIFALDETSNITFDIVIMGFIFGSLAVGFTNGGLGAYPMAVALIFALYGIPDTTGAAFGYLVWVSQTILTIVLGLICYLLLPVLNKK